MAGLTVRCTRHKMNLDQYKEGIVRVGWFAGTQYSNGQPVASVAYYNEYGKGVPARPFVRPAIHQNQAHLVDLLRTKYKQALRNNDNTLQVLGQFGMYVKGLIQQQIINTNSPPNAPSTIKRKGKNSPLRDTTVMLHSIGHQVEEADK